jgi:hypothetical protein
MMKDENGLAVALAATEDRNVNKYGARFPFCWKLRVALQGGRGSQLLRLLADREVEVGVAVALPER